ncbi:hypothetical protein GCM10020256_60280 [Streptomyces thermocoprophilus]
MPSSDTTARPVLTVRETWLGPGVDAVAPYTDMSASYPWQDQRFAAYRNTGPGAVVTVPDSRPRLTPAQARTATRAEWLGGRQPGKEVCRPPPGTARRPGAPDFGSTEGHGKPIGRQCSGRRARMSRVMRVDKA